MSRVVASRHNREISKEIIDDMAMYVSKDIGNFMIELREELENETPQDTKHGAINWLIRKRLSNKEYGQRSFFPAHSDRRNYNQPQLSDNDTGYLIAESFDIRKGNGNLVLFNNVDYIGEINEGSHPAQQSSWRNKATIKRLLSYVGFIEKTVAMVEGKYGIS